MSESPFEREAAAAYLTSALTRERFLLYCQPIVQVAAPKADQRFFEVLVRFCDEEEGLLPPGSFIPVLQEAGLMALLDRWAVATAIRKLRSAVGGRRGDEAPRFSINLSSDTLTDRTFPDFVASELSGASGVAQLLVIEIPLHDAVARPAEFAAAVSALTALGCSVAVSGLSQDEVEIDRLHAMGVRYVKFNGASTG